MRCSGKLHWEIEQVKSAHVGYRLHTEEINQIQKKRKKIRENSEHKNEQRGETKHKERSSFFHRENTLLCHLPHLHHQDSTESSSHLGSLFLSQSLFLVCPFSFSLCFRCDSNFCLHGCVCVFWVERLFDSRSTFQFPFHHFSFFVQFVNSMRCAFV